MAAKDFTSINHQILWNNRLFSRFQLYSLLLFYAFDLEIDNSGSLHDPKITEIFSKKHSDLETTWIASYSFPCHTHNNFLIKVSLQSKDCYLSCSV